ncbi:MBL fold metallo-hydrolase [Pantoea sp. CCBC3-3-1]|uniref:MBL fold metallo-hydrolase n=1 Tax=Pantoea sp. CCBC3-3-1 TaxID=2490851 RepID=UPI0011BD77B2|nr:MBL fold metallo-hydrolase [Pantoea sp. CCBC3-3-1]
MDLSTQVFISSDKHDGFGVSSTLIMGKKEALLVDAQFTLANAHRLVADIIESGRELKRIFITHLHPDHFLGLEVIKQVFPDADVISCKTVASDVNDAFDFKIDYWGREVLQKNGAKTKFAVRPVEEDTLYLEGHEIKILGQMSGDCITIAPLWIPSLKTLIASDLVFNNAHVWIADMRTPERIAQWMQSLDIIEALRPEAVVPGHSSLPGNFSPSAIGFTRRYIQDFLNVLQRVGTSEALIAEMERIYPDLPVKICLEYSAKIIKDKYNWPGDWPVSLRNMTATLQEKG